MKHEPVEDGVDDEPIEQNSCKQFSEFSVINFLLKCLNFVLGESWEPVEHIQTQIEQWHLWLRSSMKNQSKNMIITANYWSLTILTVQNMIVVKRKLPKNNKSSSSKLLTNKVQNIFKIMFCYQQHWRVIAVSLLSERTCLCCKNWFIKTEEELPG